MEADFREASVPFAYTIEALIKLQVLRVFLSTGVNRSCNHLSHPAIEEEDSEPEDMKSMKDGHSSCESCPSFDGAKVNLVDKRGATFIEISVPQAASLQPHKLEIPLPDEVVVDRQQVSVTKRPDHLELKLRIVASLGEGNWGRISSSSSLGSRTLVEKGSLACAGCGLRSLKSAFRNYCPMPSDNWEEVADHWFDLQCGCGGPVKASLMAKKVQALLIPTRGTCLVGSTSYLVHESDLLTNGGETSVEGSVSSDEGPEGEKPHSGRGETGSVPQKNGSTEETDTVAGAAESRGGLKGQPQCSGAAADMDPREKAATAKAVSGDAESASIRRTDFVQPYREVDCGESLATEGLASCQLHSSVDVKSSRGETGHTDGKSVPSCCERREPAADVAVDLDSEGVRQVFEGPMEPTEYLVGARKWVRVCCPGCARTVGVRRSTEDESRTALSLGVYLFKHRVIPCDGPTTSVSQPSRREALLGHFSARLQQAAEQTGSSRFLLQGLLTGRRYCQLTVLSKETFVWSGGSEGVNRGSGRSRGLKVLLTEQSGAEATAKGKGKSQAEAVCLLEEDAEEVLCVLKANSEKYPPTCRSFNGASLSFL